MAFLEFEINEIEKAYLVQEKTKNWKSSIRKLSMDAELSIPCKVPMPLPDMTDREPGSSGRGSSGAFQSDRVR